jgi:hypothetical protein
MVISNNTPTLIERGQNYDKYLNSDGSFTNRISLGIINFLNETNEYEPINIKIIEISKTKHGRNYHYAVEAGLYKAYFNKYFDQQDGILFEKNNSFLTFQTNALYYRDNKSNQWLSSRQSVIGNSDENKFTYENALGSGFNLSYEYLKFTLKEKLTIENLSVLPIPEDYVLDDLPTYLDLDFQIDYETGTDIYIDNELWDKKSTKTTQSRIDFRINNETLYYLSSPYAYDSNNSRQLLTYQLKKTGAKLYITVKTPYSWLNSSDRIYPVYIDPTGFRKYNRRWRCNEWGN